MRNSKLTLIKKNLRSYTEIYRNFISMDANKNGLIEPDEFFDVPELRDNPIVQRIINVFDKNGDGNGRSASMNSSGG